MSAHRPSGCSCTLLLVRRDPAIEIRDRRCPAHGDVAQLLAAHPCDNGEGSRAASPARLAGGAT